MAEAIVSLAFALAVPLAVQEPPAQQLRFRETVDVERLVVEVRAVSEAGDPLLGLGPGEFRVKVDGKPVTVESAFWVAETAEISPPAAGAVAAEPAVPTGRSVVFLFQWSHEASRMGGLLKMRRAAEQLLARLHPDDRVAVLSFDSRLRLWQDFTTDRGRVARALARMLAGRGGYGWGSGDEISIGAGLDPQAAADASSIELALTLLGQALAPIPGAKSLAFFGWGFGRFSAFGVRMEPDYDQAREALKAARVAVFCLDVTDADYHSLETGLREVARDTGGFYARTHVFPGQALRRLEGALAGYYVLSFPRPEGARPPYKLDVHLVGRKGDVLVRETY